MHQLVALLSLASSAMAKCECGYSVSNPGYQSPLLFTDAIESNFRTTDRLGEESEWIPQQFNVTAEDGRGRYGKMFLPGNVAVEPKARDTKSTGDEGLRLYVGGQLAEDAVSGAEADSKRLDIHWGSFRAGMKVTDVNGTCAAFFWYFNDTQEIDMEFLSREYDRDEEYYPINLVVQTEQSKEAGYDASKTGHFKRVNLGFDPAAQVHEYRFDYTPGKVVFFADGKMLAEMGGDGMPSSGGHLILQHWSNGNPQWSGGPPEQDAMLLVSYVRAYFNSSDTEGSPEEKDHGERCRDEEMVCEVKDVTDGSTGDVGNGAGDGNTGDEDDAKSRGERSIMMVSRMGWTATLAAMMGLLD